MRVGESFRAGVASVWNPAWMWLLSEQFRRRLAPIAVALLASGSVLAALAQVYLTLAYEPGRPAPFVGVFGLTAGLVLFTVGVFGRGAGDDSPDALSGLKMPSLHVVGGRLTPLRGITIAVGVILLAILVFRLGGGSESGWDLLLWLVALCALAAPFIRRPSFSLANVEHLKKRYPDMLIVVALVVIFVALNSHDLTDWYYSAIGDEYAHYSFSRELVEEGIQRPFDLKGVYSEINPVMASLYPALVMRLVGIDNFGWKFSLILSIALTIPGVYILGYVLAGRIAAVVSSTILASSHYIFAFMHTGYPNTDVLLVIVWSLTLFVLGLRRGNALLIYGSGLLGGFGLLFNSVARAAIVVIILFGLSLSEVRRHLASLWPWALGVSLTMMPLLLVNGSEVVSTAFVKIVGPGSQHASEYEGILSQVTANAHRNLLAFNYNPYTSHYVSGALLDSISAVLALLGLGYCLGTVQRASSRLLLILFAVTAAGTALLSPYPYVPITRMASMLLPLSLMAGVAAAYLYRTVVLPSDGDRRPLQGIRGMATLGMLCTAVLALNVLQFWSVTPGEFHHTQEAVAVGAMRSDACEGEPDGVIMVGRSTVPLLTPALESYHPDGDLPHLLDHADARLGNSLTSDLPRCVVFLNPDDSDIQDFKRELTATYPEGQFVTFSSPSGKATVEIFKPGAG